MAGGRSPFKLSLLARNEAIAQSRHICHGVAFGGK
jgi:hypothetical protein